MRTRSPRIRAPHRAARPERATAPARALTALALTLTACGADGALSNVDPPDDTRPADRVPGILSNLREDFINRELVESHGGVELDVNRGLVRLPTQTIPEIRGEALKSYATTVDENGVVTAAQILVENGAVLRASDAIELVATDLLRVSGEIRAGRGGLTLAAGKRLVIDGHIESEGPIHIAIGDEDGTIELTGTILAAATPEGLVPSITLSGRGTATIGGRVETVAMAGGTSGSVFAHLYGALVVGPWARVATLAEPGGIAGGIRLKSEREITLHEGASIGAASKIAGLAPEGAALAGTGDVELEADVIELGPRSAITGGDTLDVGGSIAITVGSSLTVHDGAIVRAGGGAEGGTLLVDARGAKLQPDALLSAGTGLDRAGLARLEIAGPLT
ncbi:hypothetical protein L6R52_01015, partial [Myxococcota bacterium]|nr:hypothetical protein [Myxococcota bacterium]